MAALQAGSVPLPPFSEGIAVSSGGPLNMSTSFSSSSSACAPVLPSAVVCGSGHSAPPLCPSGPPSAPGSGPMATSSTPFVCPLCKLSLNAECPNDHRSAGASNSNGSVRDGPVSPSGGSHRCLRCAEEQRRAVFAHLCEELVRLEHLCRACRRRHATGSSDAAGAGQMGPAFMPGGPGATAGAGGPSASASSPGGAAAPMNADSSEKRYQVFLQVRSNRENRQFANPAVRRKRCRPGEGCGQQELSPNATGAIQCAPAPAPFSLFAPHKFEPPALARPPDAQWPAFLNQLYQPRGLDAAPVGWPVPPLQQLPPPAALTGACIGPALIAPHANIAVTSAAASASSSSALAETGTSEYIDVGMEEVPISTQSARPQSRTQQEIAAF